MVNTYKIRYRRKGSLFWKSKVVIGHKIDLQFNRLDMFLTDGSLFSLGEPSDYDIFLGTDWVLMTKQQMERQAAQQINVTPKAKGAPE